MCIRDRRSVKASLRQAAPRSSGGLPEQGRPAVARCRPAENSLARARDTRSCGRSRAVATASLRAPRAGTELLRHRARLAVWQCRAVAHAIVAIPRRAGQPGADYSRAEISSLYTFEQMRTVPPTCACLVYTLVFRRDGVRCRHGSDLPTRKIAPAPTNVLRTRSGYDCCLLLPDARCCLL